MFDIPKLFLLGGPDNATLTTNVFIYNQAFSGSYMYNRAAAASMIMLVIIAILSGILFMILEDKDEAALRRLNIQQEKNFKRRQKELFLKEKAQMGVGRRHADVESRQVRYCCFAFSFQQIPEQAVHN